MKDSIRLPGNVIVFPDGSIHKRRPAPYHEVRAHQLGPDQLEVTAKRPYLWEEITREDLDPSQLRYLRGYESRGFEYTTQAEEEERKARSLRISANRAKTRVRKLCKTMGADTLVTLTYRANQTDLELLKKHLRAFVRRCRRFWPEFTAVASFEPQKRGAWHAHLAMAQVPHSFKVRADNGSLVVVKSFNYIRDQWRRVVGDLGGNIDVSRRKRTSRKTPAQIASYLSKYILKAFEDGESGSNRYTRFGGDSPPPSVMLGRYADPLAALVDCYALVDSDASIVQAIWSPFGDWFFLAAERKKRALGARDGASKS